MKTPNTIADLVEATKNRHPNLNGVLFFLYKMHYSMGGYGEENQF